jgi:uncharacterized protein YhfF
VLNRSGTRATAGLLWTNERTNKPLPTVGALSVLTDWQGAPLCIIESTHIEIVPFDGVSDSFAAIEGEGDKTLRYWREAHWRFFSRECQRIGREPDLHMPVVCEQFKVVYPTCDRGSCLTTDWSGPATPAAQPGVRRHSPLFGD